MQRSAESARESTLAGGAGAEAPDQEAGALQRAWEQWEGAVVRARDRLRDALAQADGSEREFRALAAQLEQELREFEERLCNCGRRLLPTEGRTGSEELAQGWHVAKVGAVPSASMPLPAVGASMRSRGRGFSPSLGGKPCLHKQAPDISGTRPRSCVCVSVCPAVSERPRLPSACPAFPPLPLPDAVGSLLPDLSCSCPRSQLRSVRSGKRTRSLYKEITALTHSRHSFLGSRTSFPVVLPFFSPPQRNKAA